MATVVVDLCGTASVSSNPRDASVITASVDSTSTSDTARIAVVLPTPKPPVTRIFAEAVGSAAALARDTGQAIAHPPKQFHVFLGGSAGGVRQDFHQSGAA